MITKDLAKQLNTEVKDAVKIIAEKHGLTVSLGCFSYGESEGGTKVKFQTIKTDENGNIETLEAKNFKLYAKTYGLNPNDLGRVFVCNGEKYRICGLKPSRRKYPICAKREKDNKGFKFPANMVVMQLV